MGLVDMGLNIISVRDSWKQHHHSLEAGERCKNGHGSVTPWLWPWLLVKTGDFYRDL